ncbi:hypothetical protein [Streptomyces griseosporeus]|uniref:hypothetical protein n=1 Tax=Streptomyces griseosporeus TaxID=1910 RepID=UPI00167E7AA0|nr:hypothetical protein [Streptomyces griseosporeus]GHF43956.1 hypothetical protein GCM10018783_11130 [Streptomyces griseosporeus]
MGSLLVDVGRRIADRWLSAVVLPGLLLVGTTVVALTLGHRHGLDARFLVDTLDRKASGLDGRPASMGALVVGAGLAATAAGLVNRALAALVETVWLRQWPGRLGAPLVNSRHQRWEAADEAFEAARAASSAPGRQDRLDRLAARRARIGVEPPCRPTWIGDRVAAADRRVWQQYRIDLVAAWPRLWLIVPDAVRTAITGARDRLDAATRLTAWAVPYAVLATRWWPAAVIALAAVVAGRQRGRSAAAGLADLAESVVDLHGHDLAAALRIEAPAGHPLSHAVGLRITEQLRKGA